MGKLNIGRIPIMKGEFVVGKSYNRLWQVTYLGSTYQSKIDNNSSSPAEIVDGLVTHKNTDKWICIADATNARNSTKNIENEITRAKQAESEISKKIDTLSDSIPSQINSAVNVEKNRAVNAENTINGRIDDLIASSPDVISDEDIDQIVDESYTPDTQKSVLIMKQDESLESQVQRLETKLDTFIASELSKEQVNDTLK